MKKYRIEQINVSDTEYKLTGIFKSASEAVKQGDLIFSYESSKMNFDVPAEEDGYVFYNDQLHIGDVLLVGRLVAFTAGAQQSAEEISKVFADAGAQAIVSREDQIITKKARRLIADHNIDVGVFAAHEIISEDVVEEYLNKLNPAANSQNIDYYYTSAEHAQFDKGLKKLAIIGAGKAALQVYDAVLAAKVHQVVFLYDDNKKLAGKSLMGVPIRGAMDFEQIKADHEQGLFDEIIVSFSGDIDSRKKIFLDVAALNIPIANVVHPTSLVSNFVKMGVGNILFANVRIGPFAEIGDNNVISSLCSLEHHNHLGSHNTFGPAVVFSGSCTIGDGNKFGTGIYIEPKIKIGSNSVISSGVVLRQSVPSDSVVRNLNKIEVKPLGK